MKPQMNNLAEFLEEKNTEISQQIVDSVLDLISLEIPRTEKERAVTMYKSFLNFLSTSLKYEGKTMPAELLEWSKQNAYDQVSANGKISEIIRRYPPTREVFTDLVSEWTSTFGLSTEDYTLIVKKVNNMLDISLEETVFAFEEYNAKVKEEFKEEIDIISFPIVPLTEKMAVIPLVGKLNQHRSNHLVDSVLPKVNELKIDYLIVDFSGVCEIDDIAAVTIQNVRRMLRLLGIQMISTGISPQLAKKAISIGIETNSSQNTFKSVKQALENMQ
ncbi:STAS domain-containing protein [Rossellomorea vietnamensis]|uniref:STAS domain-containing protein n=1 Tax=Rossellomorea vietnamensis TaxID=218284 RepID=A0A5D4MCL7_9BACI|nr:MULTISPECIES: STAS domain-containing protein [Bacillaceae]TYR99238.1 STAS domain-containing protein [Rossellomorea vietnamensis]